MRAFLHPLGVREGRRGHPPTHPLGHYRDGRNYGGEGLSGSTAVGGSNTTSVSDGINTSSGSSSSSSSSSSRIIIIIIIIIIILIIITILIILQHGISSSSRNSSSSSSSSSTRSSTSSSSSSSNSSSSSSSSTDVAIIIIHTSTHPNPIKFNSASKPFELELDLALCQSTPLSVFSI